MIVRTARFIKSSSKFSQCPSSDKPEFAIIGRSNVGKSSLINMITGIAGLAKISGTPGKTRTINHFLVNDEWYIADLPGYGYAKVSARIRDGWLVETEKYILGRNNLVCLFVVIDSRIEPQKSDLLFMEMVGLNQIPLARIFTKSDKLRPNEMKKIVARHNDLMIARWEEMPPSFITSSSRKRGREELLDFIEQSINIFKKSG